MNSACIKSILRNPAVRQIVQCHLGTNTNQNCGNVLIQEPCRKFSITSNVQSSIVSKLLHSGIRSSSKTFHTISILYNSSIKSTDDAHKPLGLADELLAASIKSNAAPVEDEETRKQQEEEKARSMRALKFGYISFGSLILISAGLTVYAWGVPQMDENGRLIEDEFTPMPILKQYIYRTHRELKNMNRMIQEPSSHKLLPDPLTAPYYQPPYTLVLELTDVLVHPEWTYQSGWRFKKRPGVEFLLQHCAPPVFEIVLYTNEVAMTAHPVMEQLDPNNAIWYRLYKDGTRYENGKHYKDLYCLNRDLNKVIAIDWNKGSSTSPSNTLNIKRWDGNMHDSTLVDLAVMVRTIAESDVGDVREVLEFYNTFDDPIGKFKENHRLALERENELTDRPQRKSILSGYTKIR